MKAIDVHMHPFTEKILASTPDWFWAHPGDTFGFGPKAKTIEETLGEMDVAGVEHGVLLAHDAETAQGWRVRNEDVAELAEAHPDRLSAFASVDPNKGPVAVAELEYAVRELGMKGLKLHPPTQHFYINDHDHYPLWAKCQELGIPILLHTGQNQSKGLIKYADPILVDEVALEFPDLRIILAHFGFPWVSQAISVCWIRPNCYLELSGWAPQYIPEEVWRYARSILKDRTLFGTDYPVILPERWLREFEAIPLKPEVKQKIVYDNAHRLLFGREPATHPDGHDAPALEGQAQADAESPAPPA